MHDLASLDAVTILLLITGALLGVTVGLVWPRRPPRPSPSLAPVLAPPVVKAPPPTVKLEALRYLPPPPTPPAPQRIEAAPKRNSDAAVGLLLGLLVLAALASGDHRERRRR